MIDESTVNKVFRAASIPEDYELNLKKAGNGIYSCNCPFHTENSASFMVYADGHYHCYGCGEHGNIASFIAKRDGINYYEAIRKLAEKHHIEIDEQVSRTPEQIETEKRRELARLTYEKVQAYFAKQLNYDNEECKEAFQYATGRWGAEFVLEYGIGYSKSDSKDFLAFVEKSALPKDILLDLGLLKNNEETGELYAFFRGRIMIPIRSTSHLTIGYTARLVDSIYEKKHPGKEDKPSKYLNSTNSLLYNKSKSIFGFDVARATGTREDRFYMVEGGPDVLRLQSIGVKNVVASLGGNWNVDQLKFLHKYAHNLCLIPDIDKVPEGKPWGEGIKKVIETAERAYEEGFDTIEVIEIPSPGAKKKIDADEYFTDINKFKQTSSEDFCLWYAKKLMDTDPSKELEYITTLAHFLSYVSDYRLTYALNKLKVIIPSNVSTWKTAILKIKRTRAQDAIAQSNQHKETTLDTRLLDEYGFQEMDNHYVSIGRDGNTKPWSNFVLRPLFHVRDVTRSSRLFEIINQKGHREILELTTEEFGSSAKFRVKVESLGNFIWLAKDEQIIRLKQYLFDVMDTAQLVNQLGWQRKWNFYAFGNGAFYEGRWYPTNEYGIITLDSNTPEKRNYYVPSASKIYADNTQLYNFERKFVHQSHGDFSLKQYVSTFIEAFGDNAKVAFAFFLAALFRDIIVLQTKSFPILNVFGPVGTGKSEFGHSLMSFFIIENTPPSLKNSTIAALADAVAQCSNAVVHLDEFKDGIDLDKVEFLKGLWDGAGRNRMSMDKDKKREVSAVDTAVIITGQEMASKDNALFSRLIYLTTEITSNQHTPEERDAFQRLVLMRKQGCSHLTLEILKHRPQFEEGFRHSWNTVADQFREKLTDVKIEERIFNNWMIPLTALYTLRNSLDLPFDYEDYLNVCDRLIRVQSKQNKDNDEISAFWNAVAVLYQNGEIVEGCDFSIEYVNSFRLEKEKGESEGRLVQLDPARKILFLRYRRIFAIYSKFGKDYGLTLLNQNSMRYYIESSKSFFFGRSATKRFKALGGNNTLTQQDCAYCIDYEVIKETYHINLEIDGMVAKSE